jgi:hypothetical protein
MTTLFPNAHDASELELHRPPTIGPTHLNVCLRVSCEIYSLTESDTGHDRRPGESFDGRQVGPHGGRRLPFPDQRDPVARDQLGERQEVGGQAASGRNFGYHRRKTSSSSLLRTLVRICSRRWAPRRVHCICCFFTNLLLTTWLMVDSTNAVLIVSPCRHRSPKFGMNSWLLRM